MTRQARTFEAIIAAVDPGSPADRLGIEAGAAVLAVNGEPLRDVIQWRWEAADESVAVRVRDRSGLVRELELRREEGQDWGIEFADIVFDGIRRCANHCTFCFIDGMPEGLRPSLTIRDDDYRLSFLTGTFATLTNLTEADLDRIVTEGLSPLRVSLHAVDPAVRATLIGPVADRGMRAIEWLLSEGIEMHMQVVLVPGVNDGAILEATLTWASAKPQILSVGIVPVGYTKFSPISVGYDTPEKARAVLETIEPFGRAAEVERGGRWVYAADEFYLMAYGAAVLDHLPKAAFYGDFELFEDGIGIIRTTVDETRAALACGADRRLADGLDGWDDQACIPLIVGEAMTPWFATLVVDTPLAGRLIPLVVANDYFGGNVDVTGLLCGRDIVNALRRFAATTSRPIPLAAIPAVIFNDDGLTLDGWSVSAIESETGLPLTMVSLITSRWLDELTCAVVSRPSTLSD